MIYTWIFDLDHTLYQYRGNPRDFDYSRIESDPQLKDKIKVLPGRKLMYTNANLWHTLKCVQLLKIEKAFHKISCRELSGLKPHVNSFIYFQNMMGINKNNLCFFFEDTIDNLIMAKNFGWQTVYIGEHPKDIDFARKNPSIINYTFPDISSALEYFYHLVHQK